MKLSLTSRSRVVAGATVLLLSFVSQFGTAADSPLLYKMDFESGTLTGWQVSGNPAEVVNSPTRLGNKASRHLVDYNTSTVKYRTELKAAGSGDNFAVADRKEYWYGWSVYIPADQVPDPRWQIVTQFHQAPDANLGEEWSNPVFALYVTDGKWEWYNRWDSRTVTPPNTFQGTKSWSLGAHPLGKWTDFVVHVKWSYENDGILQLWKDGQLIIDKTGPNCMNNATIPAFKMGIYKGWKSNTPTPGITRRIVYTDEFRMAGQDGSYAAVSPGTAVEQPEPMPPTDVRVQ